MNLQQALASLRDINGITGSFIVGNAGQVIARDTPTLLAEEILAPVAPRLVRLWDTLREVDPTLDQAVVSYESQKLYVRPVVQGLLCTIVALGTNMPALRMAVNLLLKKINPHLLELRSEGGPIELSRDTSPSFSPHPPLSSARSPQPLDVTSQPAIIDRPSAPPEGEQGAPGRYIVHRGRRYLA